MAATHILLVKFLVLLSVLHCQAYTVELRVYKSSFTDYVIVPLDKICDIVQHIDLQKVNIFYTNGLGGSPTGPQVEAMVTAVLSTQQYNMIFLDWSKESQVGPLGVTFSYITTGVPNAITIGCIFGTKLAALVKCGVDIHKIYLIGHSLGAHLMGQAGRCALDCNVLIPRITGLDPSGPLFQVAPALDKTCAYFVDILHTDWGHYGTNCSTGTVDIWPNYNVNGGVQPGCKEGKFEQFTPEDLCSHIRAVLLFCEGILHPHTLIAAGAKTYYDWLQQDGTTNDITYIGPLTLFTAEGNYYLTTNGQSLYSKGEEGLKPPPQ